MSEETSDRVEHRAAHLLPEERSVGSDDPEAQAEAVLVESDRREAGAVALAESDPGTKEAERQIAEAAAAPDSFLERRSSAETVAPESAETVTPEQTETRGQTPDRTTNPDQPATPEPPG